MRGRNPALNPTFPILGPYADEHRFFHCCRGQCTYFALGSAPLQSPAIQGQSPDSIRNPSYLLCLSLVKKRKQGDRNFAWIFSMPGTVVSVTCVQPSWVRHTKPMPDPQQHSLCCGGSGALRDQPDLRGHWAPRPCPPDSLFPHCPILVRDARYLPVLKVCLCWVFGMVTVFLSSAEQCVGLCSRKPCPLLSLPPCASGPQRFQNIKASGRVEADFSGVGAGISMCFEY